MKPDSPRGEGNTMRLAILTLMLLCRPDISAAGNPSPDSPADAAPVHAKKETLLAVMDIVNNTGEYASFVEGMPDMLITELMETGDVKLVERTKVQTAMKALKMETSGLTQERNLELGKWLGVDGILFGTFNRVEDKFRLDVRAIDVITGKINAAASVTCGKGDILDMIPEMGRQLRIKLSNASLGRTGPVPPPAAPPPATEDSCALSISFKMGASLLTEAAIPHQRVRIYLDNRLVMVSGTVDGLNRYFTLFKGKIPAGGHTLALVHGAVDAQGRWVRPLQSQPERFAFTVRKDDNPSIRYRMHAHEGWFDFKPYALDYHGFNQGD